MGKRKKKKRNEASVVLCICTREIKPTTGQQLNGRQHLNNLKQKSHVGSHSAIRKVPPGACTGRKSP